MVVISRQCGRNGIHLTFGDLGLPGHQRFRNCSRPPALLTWTDFARSFEVPRAVPSGSFGHSETGPKWVLGEISPVMSRYIMLAGSGLRQRPRSTALRVSSAYSGIPRRHGGLPSRLLWLHPSTQPSIAAGASSRCTAGAPGALPKPGGCRGGRGRSVLLRAGRRYHTISRVAFAVTVAERGCASDPV